MTCIALNLDSVSDMNKRYPVQKRVSNSLEDEGNPVVSNRSQTNGIQNNGRPAEDEADDVLDCASLPQSYNNEWRKLFLRKDYLKHLKSMGMQGSLRSSRFRSVCWKLFMGVIPEDVSHWLEEMREYRSLYDDLKMQMIVNPRKAEPRDLSINNPLSQVVESPWNQFFIDNALRLTIKQDVIRTFPEIDFFNTASIHVLMVEALFVYAKKHPHIAYMQGMHELLAPLIFVLHCDQQAFLHACENDSISDFIKEILNPEYLEHDAFAIFCKMMETIEPWYVSKEMPPVVMTNSMITTPFARPQELIPSNVIVTKLTRVQDYLLKRFDVQLFEHLQKLDIAPQVYGIRWVRLLFGREYPFQDLLILWDAIFSDGIGFDLVDYIFVAMLMYLRTALLSSDYSSCLTPLMKFPPVPDVHYFINKALYLRDPKNKPPVVDQFYCKPSPNNPLYDGNRRNGETSSLSSRFSRLVRGKRPGTLFISSGLMSKSTSEPMNLITDSALSPVKENFQFTSSRKGSSASLPPPDIGTPILPCNAHNFSCQSLHRLDSVSLRNEAGQTMDGSTGSPHSTGKFFIFGARGGRKNLATSVVANKAKQMKGTTSEQEVVKALNSYSDVDALCRRCALELDAHIGTLQRHLFRRDMQNGPCEDEAFLALAGIKQIRDVLKGSVKPSFLYDSPEHGHGSANATADGSLGSLLASMRRRQQPTSAQSSLSGTPMCDRPYGKFFLATPDLTSCELESPEVDLKSNVSEASVHSKNKSPPLFFPVLRTPSKTNLLPSEVELGEVNNAGDGKEADSRMPGTYKTSESMHVDSPQHLGDQSDSGPHSILFEHRNRSRNSPSRTLQQIDAVYQQQQRNKEGEMRVVKRREGSPMDRLADMFRSFGKF